MRALNSCQAKHFCSLWVTATIGARRVRDRHSNRFFLFLRPTAVPNSVSPLPSHPSPPFFCPTHILPQHTLPQHTLTPQSLLPDRMANPLAVNIFGRWLPKDPAAAPDAGNARCGDVAGFKKAIRNVINGMAGRPSDGSASMKVRYCYRLT